MNTPITRLATRTLAVGLLTTLGGLLAGCVATGYEGGSGYEGGAEIGYGVDYYEPYGYDYGGWRPGYRVGPPPPRGHDDRGRDDQGHPGGRPVPRPSHAPAYHPAPSGRPMPSIPSNPRGGHSEGGDRGHRGGH